MSNKGISQNGLTKYKIGLANQKDRTELVQKIIEYIDNLKPDDVPSIVSASLHAGIAEKNLIAWEISTAENSEIRILLDFIRDRNKQYLIDNGLKNKINGKLTTTLLKSEHGLREEPTQLTQNNTFNIAPEVLAEALQLARTTKK